MGVTMREQELRRELETALEAVKDSATIGLELQERIDSAIEFLVSKGWQDTREGTGEISELVRILRGEERFAGAVVGILRGVAPKEQYDVALEDDPK